jgi:ATP-dependent protease ClpP protease subunit
MSYAREYGSFDPFGGLTEDEEAAADGPYWLRHWRGQLSLARSYWVNGFFVNIATFAGQAFILGLAQSRQLALVAWSFVIFVVFALALRIWSFVGIWRSAGRHSARGGSVFWALASRAMVVVAVVGIVASGPQLWSQVREMALIATGNDPIGAPAVIEVSANGDEISLDGSITSGVSEKLRRILDAAPNARKLMLKSRGGRILEALAMVDLIKARRLDTRVVDNCESACTLLFLAGAQRSASPLAAIGFHQPDFPGLSSQDRDSMIQSNREDYRAAGITDQFIDRIMATPPERIWYPTGEEMTEGGVLNAVVVSSHRSDREESRLNEVLGQAVTNINAKRGTMIDDVTRLKGAQLNGQVIVVDYAVTKPLSLSASQFSNGMTPAVRKNICAGPDGALISSGGKYRFNYRYENGRNIGTIVVDRC